MRFRITKCKAQIAGNSQTIAKICNAAIGDSGLIDADHELIRGSLSNDRPKMKTKKAGSGDKMQIAKPTPINQGTSLDAS